MSCWKLSTSNSSEKREQYREIMLEEKKIAAKERYKSAHLETLREDLQSEKRKKLQSEKRKNLQRVKIAITKKLKQWEAPERRKF